MYYIKSIPRWNGKVENLCVCRERVKERTDADGEKDKEK